MNNLNYIDKNLQKIFYKNRQYYVIVLMGFLISLLYTSPLVTALTNDKEVFRYIAMLVSKGFLPYRDAFEIRPPIIFFLGALFSKTEWSFWFLFSAIVSFSGIAFYKIAVTLKTKYPYFCTAIYFLLLRWPLLAEGGGLTYELTAAFVTIITFFYVFRQNNSLILLGVFTAVVFFTQQNDILCLLPVIFYAIFSRIKKKVDSSKLKKLGQIVKNLSLVVLGFCIIVLSIFAYFAYYGTFLEFINDVFLFVPHYYVNSDSLNFGTMFFMTFKLLLVTGLLPITLIVLFNTYFVFANRLAVKKHKEIFFITIASLILVCISANVSGRYYPHYLLDYGSFLAIQVALFTYYVNNKQLYKILSYLLVIGIILTSVFFGARAKLRELQWSGKIFLHPRDKVVAVYHSVGNNILNPYEQLVSDAQGKDGQLYVFGNVNASIWSMNTNLQIVSPVMWMGSLNSLVPTKAMEIHSFNKVMNGINKNHTKYILDFSNDETFKTPRLKKKWDAMLDKYYVKTVPIIWNGSKGCLYIRSTK